MLNSKKTILLVEDEVIIAMTEAMLLERNGYRVITAVSGEEAVHIVENNGDNIDLVLMDIDLGEGMDGTEAASRILKKREIPVVFLSAHTEPEIVEKTENITSYGYVVKNSGDTVLLASLKMAFRLFEAQTKIQKQREELGQAVEQLKVSNEELVRSQEELLGREVEISYLLKSMINAFVLFESVFDEDGKFSSCRFVYINDAYERITGVKNDQVKGKTVHEVWPGTEESWVEAYGSVAVTGVSRSFEMYHGPTKKMYHCNVYRPWKTKERFCVVFEDITEKKKTEEKLRNSSDLLNATQRIAKTGGWEWDILHNTMSWTDETYRIHGMEPGEIEADTPDHIAKSIACYEPADRPVIERAFRRCIDEGKEYDLEFPFTAVDGNRKWIRTIGMPVFNEGKVVKVVGYIMDISDRKTAEEELKKEHARMHQFLDIAGVIIVVTNSDQTIGLINRKGCELLGREESELLGQNWFDVAIPFEKREEVKNVFSMLMNGIIEPVEYFENEIERADGERRLIAWHNTMIHDETGRIVGTLSSGEDITEKRHTEDTLRLRDAAITAAANGVVITDQEGFIIWANPAFSRLTGYTLEEVVGKNPRELVKSGRQDMEFYSDMWKDILSGKVWQGILINRRKNGTEYTEEMTITPLKNKSGNISHFIAVKQDVSARLRTEKKLMAVYQRLNAVFENANDGIVAITENRIMAMCNRAASEILGYPKEKLVGQSLRMIYKSDEYFEEVGRRIYPEVKGKGFYRGEVEIVRGDGQVRFCDIAISRINADDDAAGIIGVFRDITDEKRDLQRILLFKEMLDVAPNLITVHERTGKFLYANRKTFEMHGYDENEFMSKNIYEIDIPSSVALMEERMRLIEEFGEAHFEVAHYKSDGSSFPLEVFVRKVEWEGMPAMLSIATDIKERKLQELELQRALEEKQSLLRELQHRIKNTLAMIASIINLEADNATDETTKSTLNDLRGRISSLSNLYALLYASGEVRQVSLGRYIRSIGESIMEAYNSEDSRICFEYHIDNIVIDTRRASYLGLILNELLMNALKHAFPGHKKGNVEIALFPNDETLILEVADNGIGLPDGFDPARSRGSGIRLVMMLTKQMNGVFECENIPGARFRVKVLM